MQEHDLFIMFVDPLNELSIPYAVTGAVASIIYGEPRLTHDVDIVLELNANNINKLITRFPADTFYTPPYEVIVSEVNRDEHGHFNIIHQSTGLRADIYLAGENTFLQWAIDNCKSISIEEKSYKIAPPEYVIILKMEYYREGGSDKHLRDIHAMLEISRNVINISLLKQFIKDRYLEEIWNKISKSLT